MASEDYGNAGAALFVFLSCSSDGEPSTVRSYESRSSLSAGSLIPGCFPFFAIKTKTNILW